MSGVPEVFSNSRDLHLSINKLNSWLDVFEESCLKLDWLGERFISNYLEIGCKVVFEKQSFLYNKRFYGCYDPFENEIVIKDLRFDCRGSFFGLVFHEGIHAIQYNSCALPWANFGNEDIAITLCPHDYILGAELLERDAIVKDRLFASFYSYIEDDVEDPVLLDFYKDEKAINEHFCNSQIDLFTCYSEDQTLRHDYIEEALCFLEEWVDWLECAGDEGLEWKEKTEFVRMEEVDVWQLGNSLGVNSMNRDKSSVKMPNLVMKPDAWDRLKRINKSFGIKDSKVLPTLGEALESKGLTREAFLKKSRELYL
jgi:hypothetical protein